MLLLLFIYLFYLFFSIEGRYTVGQNVATSTSKISWFDVINKWAFQNQSFQYGALNNNVTMVKDYIQVDPL